MRAAGEGGGGVLSASGPIRKAGRVGGGGYCTLQDTIRKAGVGGGGGLQARYEKLGAGVHTQTHVLQLRVDYITATLSS